MNAYDHSRLVEARGMEVLLPFVRRNASDGHLILPQQGRLARYLQETFGDVLYTAKNKITYSVEIKIEEENRHGNFFIEEWSNLNAMDRDRFANHGCSVGWARKIRCDLLFYYFLLSDELFIIDWFQCRRWLFLPESGRCRADRFPLRRQSRQDQPNDTWGRCVPIAEIARETWCRKVFPKQLELFKENAA